MRQPPGAPTVGVQVSISTKSALVCSAFMLTLGATQTASRVFLDQSSGNNSQAKSIESRGKEKKKIKFTRGISGELLTEGGEILGFTNFTASGGVELKVLYWDFDDSPHATDVFEKQVARAIKIVERGKKLDQAGKVVGERAQVTFLSKEPHESISAVLWTDGPKFHQIQSSSLPEILELERVYRN
jgi:hypothetical protein